MLDTIKNILSGNQYPLLKINRQEGYVFRQFIQDTTNVTPQYAFIYKVKFLNIENHPYKVRYYFRLITNDIYTTLNQIFDQYRGKGSAIIQYHHQNFKQAVEEYIGGFYEKIQQQDVPANLLKEPPSTLDEQQMFVIIAYYAIASLACAYFQYLEQFSTSLPTKNLPETPNDFIYDTLQAAFPKDIEISCTKQSAIEHQPQEELPIEQPTGELTDGTIDQHRQLFKEAMLKVQDIKIKGSYRHLLSNTYDWVAAEKWGKDLGIIKNYSQLEEILQDKHFREVPKNSQNLTKYRAYINKETRFPNWQCPVQDKEGLFRKFLEIANAINSIYKLGCQREHIKPYGSQ